MFLVIVIRYNIFIQQSISVPGACLLITSLKSLLAQSIYGMAVMTSLTAVIVYRDCREPTWQG